jgi:hypothetical protein
VLNREGRLWAALSSSWWRDPCCAYSVITWEAELPSLLWDTARSWPKCPERHRAKFVAPVEPLEAMAS